MKIYEINAFSEAYGRENQLFSSKESALAYSDDIRENDNSEEVWLRVWTDECGGGWLAIESNEMLWMK